MISCRLLQRPAQLLAISLLAEVLLFYFVQSSKLIPLILLKWSVLLVTIINLWLTDVTPIKRSKSSTGVPAFLSLAFSFAYKSSEWKMGRIFTPVKNFCNVYKFFSFFSLFSTPNFNSASVNSEMKQLFVAWSNFPLRLNLPFI